jgi:predicted DCC family thiol-disulfide oxidoreductase YuxK
MMDHPILLYDGACGICRRWVDYWQSLTQERVLYRPYQEAAADFPTLAPQDLAKAIFLIELDGDVTFGAAATYRLLTYAPGRGFWWTLYRRLPGFAPLSEAAYGFLSCHRGLLAFITHLLWGSRLEPARDDLTRFLFLRLFGAILICAFISLAVQILGLVGKNGLSPLAPYLAAAHQGWGASAYWRLPTLFWLNASDAALLGATIVGAVCGLFVLVDLLARPALIAAFILYLSLVYAGQIFTNYQWDQLLIETDFLAIFLTAGSPILIFLFRFLAFRFLFLAGATKLLSGDPSWQNLTALDTHFWTQPLPAPLAWPASRLPEFLLHAGTASALIVELVLAFLIFLPRRPRMLGAFAVLIFQLAIIATGNFNFFNLLTMLLCLFLFDDQALRAWLPSRLVGFIESHRPRPGRGATVISALIALVTLPVAFDRLVQPFAHRHLPAIGALTEAIAPLQIVNPYGLFITTTTTRPEIVIQGSDDGRDWRDYVLRYYPGPVARWPRWNIPHQPRLDWQMWFAAYGNAAENPWVLSLLRALLEGRAPVEALIGANPFPAHPPHYVRAMLYDYRFADPSQWPRQWWGRREAGLYFPQVSLADLSAMPDRNGQAPR